MKIFDKAKDKYVAAIVIESDGEGGYVYSGTETAVSEDDYLDLFIHNVVLLTDGVYAKAIMYSEDDGLVFAEAEDGNE